MLFDGPFAQLEIKNILAITRNRKEKKAATLIVFCMAELFFVCAFFPAGAATVKL